MGMVEKYGDELYTLLSKIWGYAETGFEEFQSAEVMKAFLAEHGFAVESPVAGMETAYVGTYGSGKPVICLLAEYDALYGMSQTADKPEYAPLEETDRGHGCGHHLLGTGAIGAALAVKDYLEQHPGHGTVKMVGCPAEESGSGKAYLARDGFFDDCDIALTWHPGLLNKVESGSSLACIQCYFDFHGVSSHAAGAPHLGRSALDAAELMSVGVNYLREHMESTERVHYAYIDAGGHSPNVVQAESRVKYLVRSTTGAKVRKLFDRVCNIARGAALMTGTTVDIIFDEGLYNTVPNFTLEDVYAESFRRVGVPEYTAEERAYAKAFKESAPEEMWYNAVTNDIVDKKALRENIAASELNDYFVPSNHTEEYSMGSTDVGDVSWVVPTAQINTACYSYGAGAHSWQWTGQGKSSIAKKGALLASEVMADAAITLIEHPELIEKATEEFKERIKDEPPYECLIPADVKPHLVK